jgi:hypothetical protein
MVINMLIATMLFSWWTAVSSVAVAIGSFIYWFAGVVVNLLKAWETTRTLRDKKKSAESERKLPVPIDPPQLPDNIFSPHGRSSRRVETAVGAAAAAGAATMGTVVGAKLVTAASEGSEHFAEAAPEIISDTASDAGLASSALECSDLTDHSEGILSIIADFF